MTVRTRVILASAVVLLLGASVPVPAQPPLSASITLGMSNGACVKTALQGNDGGDRIRVRRTGPVRWGVFNNCGAAATVEVTDFVRKADNAPSFPFEPNGNSGCRAAGGGTCTMTLVVRGNAQVTTYSYTTAINGVAYDPDIIIEQ